MKTEAMRRFITLARTGSFYQAAKQAGISVQAYSKLLSALEKELGTELATRDKNGIHLTEAGEAFLGFAQSTIANLNATVEQISEINMREQGGTGRLKMYLTHYGMQIVSRLDYLFETLIGFDLYEEPYSKILMRLENPEEDDTFCAEVFMESSQAELERRGICYEPFYRTALGVAVREDSPVAQLPSLSVSALADLSLSNYPHKEWNRVVEEVFEPRLLHNIRFESTGINMLLEYAREETSRGFIADSFGFYSLQKCPQFDTSGLKYVPLEDKAARYTAGMLYPKNHPPSLRAQAVIDRYREFSRTKVPDYYQAYPTIA